MIAHGCSKTYAAGLTITVRNTAGTALLTITVPANNTDLTLLLKANNIKGFGFWVGTTAIIVLDVNQACYPGTTVVFSMTTSAQTDSVPFEYIWDYNFTAILAKVTS